MWTKLTAPAVRKSKRKHRKTKTNKKKKTTETKSKNTTTVVRGWVSKASVGVGRNETFSFQNETKRNGTNETKRKPIIPYVAPGRE